MQTQHETSNLATNRRDGGISKQREDPRKANKSRRGEEMRNEFKTEMANQSEKRNGFESQKK